MAIKVVPWPLAVNLGVNGQDITKTIGVDRTGKLGNLFLADDGGIYMYGKANAALVAGDVVKYAAATIGVFDKTVAGDSGLGVRQLSVAQGTLAASEFGFFPWIVPSIASINFVAGAITVGKAWGVSATAGKAAAWVSTNNSFLLGTVFTDPTAAGGVVDGSIRA